MSKHDKFLQFVDSLSEAVPSSKQLFEAVAKGYKICTESAKVSPYMVDAIQKECNWDKDDIVGFLTDHWELFVNFYNKSDDVADAFKETLSATDSMADRADEMIDAD